VRGADNRGAARSADVVVIAVPYANHDAILDEIAETVAGKIVVDAVVPLVPPKVSQVHLPVQGSAAVLAQQRLGDGVRVVAAFHNVAAAKLKAGGAVDCDVLVFGNDREARDLVIALAAAAGTRGIDGGVLANAVVGEALTSVLIGINRRYKVGGAGIRITGIPEER
jgi:NADPH-dependent F420 reductase